MLKELLKRSYFALSLLAVFYLPATPCALAPAGEQLKQNPAYDSLDAAISATLNTTFSQEQKLVPGLTATDSFGSDVAISGDTAVIGAANDDSGTSVDQGSVFIYVRSGTTWSQQARIIAGDGAAGDNFGFSVAISLNTIVVGAPNDDNGSFTNQGSAYVFVRSGTTWTQQAKLTGFAQANNLFGYDVTIDGDYAAMSAKGAVFFGITGFVFVFHRAGTTWTQEEELPGDTQQRTADDDFGESIALSGNTIVIGAPSKSTTFPAPNPCNPPAPCNDCGICIFGCANSYCCPRNLKNGAVHIMVRSGTTWSVQQTFVGNASIDNCRRTVAEDSLGMWVAISGNTVGHDIISKSFRSGSVQARPGLSNLTPRQSVSDHRLTGIRSCIRQGILLTCWSDRAGPGRCNRV